MPRGTKILTRGVAGLTLASTAFASAATVSVSSASASTTPKTNSASTTCAPSTTRAIDRLIARSRAGATIFVCAGTYRGTLAVTKPVKLIGEGAVVDATGEPNGIAITASRATVKGFTVENATGEGILVTSKQGSPVTRVTVEDNVVEHNDQGNPTGLSITTSTYAQCNSSAAGPGDCGEGIHLLSVTHSTVVGNTVIANTGGILLSDELGPNAYNTIQANTVVGNLYACGVTVVSHSSAGFVSGQTAPTAAWTYDNSVVGNYVSSDGLAGSGGGVLLATPLPGGAVYGNTVSGNTILENGLAGVTVHSHAPNQDLNGNVIQNNTIGTNNLSGDPQFAPAMDLVTTGVVVASALSPIAVTISGNTISNDTNGVWTHGPVTVTGTNTYSSVTNAAVQG